jgi:hypothetical protein
MGDVYEATAGARDRLVGRVDEGRNVYRLGPGGSSERVGEVNEDGSVYRHTPVIADRRMGQVEMSTGKLFRHRSMWPDEHVGWVDARGEIYLRSDDDDKADRRLGKVTGGRAFLDGAGAFFLLLSETED